MMNKAAAAMLLRVTDLRMTLTVNDDRLAALRGVSLALAAGERLGVVGESGAGKSLLAQAIINLPPAAATIDSGEVWFDESDVLKLTAEQARRVRGRRIATIFQDPMTTLNPTLTVGRQLTELLEAHDIASGARARQMAVARLREVAIPSAEARFESYPHELSGGMRQRVVIAAALITEPALIIADEPTTALDVTTQAEIMALLSALCAKRQMGLILITHDLSLLSQTTDTIMVMYSGTVVEYGATDEVTRAPRHPYTRGLLASLQARSADGRFYQIPGSMPPLARVPAGCPFHPRCDYAQESCRQTLPSLQTIDAIQIACPIISPPPPQTTRKPHPGASNAKPPFPPRRA